MTEEKKREPVIEIEGLSKLYKLDVAPNERYSKTPNLDAEFNVRGQEEDPDVRNGKAFWALKDVSLTIYKGEVVGIIGPNGAGKSTLLKILSRVTHPTSGRARVRGSIVSLLEVGTGFHNELSGRENVFLNATILGMNRAEIEAKFDDIVEFSGIGRFIDMPVKHYSSGMRVRLGFAVAVNCDPDVLIVDEVLSVGDAEFRDKSRRKVAELITSKERTVLVVSHNMNEIDFLCSRVVLLENGKIRDVGLSEEVIGSYLSQSRTPIYRQMEAESEVSDQEQDERSLQMPILMSDNSWNLSDRTDRTGSEQVLLTELSTYAENGQRENSIISGRSVSIEVAYKTTEEYSGVRRAAFNIALSDDQGTKVFWTPSRNLVGTTISLDVEGKFVCNIPKLPLLPGDYILDLWVNFEGGVSDKINRAAVVQVSPGEFFPNEDYPKTSNGCVFVEYDWSKKE